MAAPPPAPPACRFVSSPAPDRARSRASAGRRPCGARRSRRGKASSRAQCGPWFPPPPTTRRDGRCRRGRRSEEHTSELQSLMRNSYAVFCLKKKKHVKDTSKLKKYIHTNNLHTNDDNRH